MEWLVQVLPYVDSVSAMAVIGIALVWMRYIDKEKQYVTLLKEQIGLLSGRMEKLEAEVKDCETTRASIEQAFNLLKLEHSMLQKKYDDLRLDFEKVRTELRIHEGNHV